MTKPDDDMTPTVGQSRYDAVTGWRKYFTASYWRMRWWLWRAGRSGAEIVSVGTLHIEDPKGLLADLEQPEWATGKRKE